MEPMDIDTDHDSINRSSYQHSNDDRHPVTRATGQIAPAPRRMLRNNLYGRLPPLPHKYIRLLRVELPIPDPPFRSSPLPINTYLTECPLEEAPPYNTISYVWGSSDYLYDKSLATGAIMCNDTFFPITMNLEWALHRAALFTASSSTLSSPVTPIHLPLMFTRSTLLPHGNNNDVYSYNPHSGGISSSELTRTVYLWADAICINQTDLAERSSQVSFMGEIYAHAKQVLVCIGEPPATSPPNSNLALACLVNTLAPLINGTPAAQVPPAVLNTIPPLAWQALSDILKCPWFQRVWVMQEVGMAREQPVVLYGFPPPGPSAPASSSSQVEKSNVTYEFGYRNLMEVVEWAKRRKELVIRYGIGSLRIHGEWVGAWTQPHHHPSAGHFGASPPENIDKRMTFYDLIDHASLLSCQDPRDRIYAFLAHPLAPKAADGTPLIKPDYSKPINELYLQVSKICLQELVGLRALVTVEHTPSSLEDGFPTWMTRWHIADEWNNISRLPEQVFSAGGTAEFGYRPVIDGKELFLEGLVVDRLLMCFLVSSPLTLNGNGPTVTFLDFGTPGKSDSAARVGLEDLLTFLTTSGTPPCADGSETNTRLMAFAMTICAAASKEPSDGRAYLEGLSRLVAIERFLRVNPRSALNAESEEAVGGLAFWRELSGACTGRAFAITERGRYCLVPKIARSGDQICVVRRLDVPLLMRMRVEANRRALLGEAYVCGLMHGEAIGMVQRGELRGEIFVIT